MRILLDTYVIMDAIQNRVPFADAVMAETAVSNGIDYIITRNSKDYKASPVPILTPDTFLQVLVQKRNPFPGQTGDGK